MCDATISAYDVTTHLYRVNYDDGDAEELTLDEILPVWHVSLPTIGAPLSKLFPGQGLFHGEIVGYDPFRDLYRLRYSDSGEEELPLCDVVLLLSTPDARRDDNHVGDLGEVTLLPKHHQLKGSSVIATDATRTDALPSTELDAGVDTTHSAARDASTSGVTFSPQVQRFNVTGQTDVVPLATTSIDVTTGVASSGTGVPSAGVAVDGVTTETVSMPSSLSLRLNALSPPFCPASPVFTRPVDHHLISVCDVDAQCAALVGMQFLDASGERHTVTYWDVDCGVHRVWYSAASTPSEVTHDALSKVQAWVRRDALDGSSSCGTKLFWPTVGRFGMPDTAISTDKVKSESYEIR